MKNTIKLTTLAMTALITGSAAMPVFAADAPKTSENTNGTVNVTAPTDPGTGNLTLDTAPNIDFGDVVVGTTSSATTIDNNLQTTDARATGAGWNITVQYGDGAGAVLTDINQAWKKDTVLGKGFELALAAPAYDPNNGTGNAPSTLNGVTVNTDANVIASAAGDTATGENAEGMGTWFGTFDKSNTKITIPANNLQGQYTAQLIWTLNDAPVA
ncbi:hypothetical protein RD055328_12310 [Companilactobacillus sp. RD055328]|uniref:WxL domain-containing protein n=1 Tax=Companilactobacillus sp. RD055328 TaxID=2916634 RepID=UPI001FC8222F|nr:WxL domain-containing protein [Companilactobacillus sp. RD055328]GKQ43308.1 hypothetical protein RD055328_12310 [Companilactobacillus sp. RD055328]